MSVRRTVEITCQIADMDLGLVLLIAVLQARSPRPVPPRCRVSWDVIIILPEAGRHPKILG